MKVFDGGRCRLLELQQYHPPDRSPPVRGSVWIGPLCAVRQFTGSRCTVNHCTISFGHDTVRSLRTLAINFFWYQGPPL